MINNAKLLKYLVYAVHIVILYGCSSKSISNKSPFSLFLGTMGFGRKSNILRLPVPFMTSKENL